MVERSLSMREALGSIPRSSILFSVLYYLPPFIYYTIILNFISSCSISHYGVLGFKTDTLIKLSKEYVAQSEKQITTRDVCSLIFSFIFKKTKIFLGFGLITLVLAFTFSTIVVKPIHMKTQKSRLSNTRLFLTTLFMFTSSMMIMYIIVKSQQPTQ